MLMIIVDRLVAHIIFVTGKSKAKDAKRKSLKQLICVHEPLFVQSIILVVYVTFVNVVISASWFDAHWGFHTSTVEWRKEFWCSAQQTVFCAGSNGHSCLYWITCRFPYCGM